ncbi:MAG: response regulator transcription factor [Chloroflexota bacterium]
MTPSEMEGEPDRRPLQLRPREREILQLLAEGMTRRAIADHLGISVLTVGLHVTTAMDRLGCHRYQDAIREAERLGWLHPSPSPDQAGTSEGTSTTEPADPSRGVAPRNRRPKSVPMSERRDRPPSTYVPGTPEYEQLLTIGKAAKMLGITVSGVRGAVSRLTVHPAAGRGSAMRFEPDEI